MDVDGAFVLCWLETFNKCIVLYFTVFEKGKPRAVLKRQLQNNADGVIFFGDLNYRVNLPRLEVLSTRLVSSP